MTEITSLSVSLPFDKVPFSVDSVLKATMSYCDLSIVFPSPSVVGILGSLGSVGLVLSFGTYGITSLSDFFGLTVIFFVVFAVNSVGLPCLSLPLTFAVNGFLSCSAIVKSVVSAGVTVTP